MAISMMVTGMPAVALGNVGESSPVDENGYRLVFEDNFDGTSLNRDVWNVELHEAGWVNEEWQKYVDSEENIYVKDGKLVLEATRDSEGNVTSGRISTQNKKTFTYGKFEARIKVPQGEGLLPAFWLMSNDENVYGQWPRCGEIDIMEVMGQDPTKLHGTIHYGNPHSQNQGTYQLTGSDFSQDFHTYSCEWEPGKITWFVDGEEFYTTSDWHSTTEGQGELTYPAPFDQPFYMILNLAVGGSWVGYPKEDSDFMNKKLEVDYVKVWQKDSYDENVEKPVKENGTHAEDADKNYIHNGNFATSEELAAGEESGTAGKDDWTFLTANGGVGSAVIANNEIKVETESAGTVDYSIQLVQPGLPLYKGTKYKLSFDAYADEARSMIVDISGPEKSWVRYLKDTKVELSTTKQNYEFEFDMTNTKDLNARLEFNMGNTASTAAIHLSNVKLIRMTEIDEVLNSDTIKTVRADGNYIYNGRFMEGPLHKGFWDVEAKAGVSATADVTSFEDGRRLKVVVSNAGDKKDVVLKQTELPIVPNQLYEFSFEAQADRERELVVNICGTEKVFTVGTEKKTYTVSLPAVASYDNKDIVFALGENGTIYLDTVRLVEDTLIKNGSFNAGTSGYEVYVDASASAEYVVDSMSEDNALDVTVRDTGDQDWKVQVKQNNVPLVNGKWYQLSFKAKSSVDRQIRVLMQGKEDRGWAAYSGDGDFYSLTDEYQTFTKTFQMTEETDLEAFLSICLGKVDREITSEHRVVIDEISLMETKAPVPADMNLLENADFSKGENGLEGWEEVRGGDAAFTKESVTNGIRYDITNPGSEDWHVQLKQHGKDLQEGKTYVIRFKAMSSEARTIKTCLMSTSYAWYGGADIKLEAGTVKDVEIEVTMNTGDEAADFVLSLGKYAGEDTPASSVTITDLSLTVKGDDTTPEDPTTPEKPADGELLKNVDFTNGLTGWSETIANWGGDYVTVASHEFVENGIKYVIENPGTADWHVQLKQAVALKGNTTYVIRFTAVSTEAKKLQVNLMRDGGNPWYGGELIELEKDVARDVEVEVTIPANDDSGCIAFSMGRFAGEEAVAANITLTNISLKEKVEKPEEKPEESPVVKPEGGILSDIDFADAESGWEDVRGENAEASFEAVEDGFKYIITAEGTGEWPVEIRQHDVALTGNKEYKISFKAVSGANRTVKAGIVLAGSHRFIGETVFLPANMEQNVEITVKVPETEEAIDFVIGIGQVQSALFGRARAALSTGEVVITNLAMQTSNTEAPTENPAEKPAQDPAVENNETVEAEKPVVSDSNNETAGAEKMGETGVLPAAVAVLFLGVLFVAFAFARKKRCK